MTIEQLEKGHKMTCEIKDLEEHLERMRMVGKTSIDHSKTVLLFDPGAGYSNRCLKPEFCQVPVELFMDMYCLNIEKKIIELKEEIVKL